MIAMRRDLHKHPEGGFNCHRTHQLIREALLSFGVEQENMRTAAQTGLVVDIKGTGEEVNEGCLTIAIRADIDALPMPEDNPHLEYRSTTDFAHMCGHDGHTTMLLAAAQVVASKRDQIPRNKKIRLLFQPAEEGPGGALPMK